MYRSNDQKRVGPRKLCLRITNLTGSGHLKPKIDGKLLEMYFKPMENFKACILKNCLGTIIIFKSQKFTCVGCKSRADCYILTKQIALLLNVELHNFRVYNYVLSGRLPVHINLSHFYNRLKSQYLGNYEPEIFPGVVWRVEKLTFRFFPTGVFFVTGIRYKYEFRRVVSIVNDIMCE